MPKSLVVVVLLLLLALPAQGEPSDPAAGWSATIAFDAGVKLGGCAVGDLDASNPGNEIAAVAVDGRIFLVHHADGAWHGEVIAKAGGEMIQCAIGDADQAREGNELVVVGMAEGTEGAGGKGAVHLLYRDGDAWKLEPVYEDDELVHGACIADVDPLSKGNEIAVVGFSRRATILAKPHGKWSVLARVPLPGAGKAVVPFAGGLIVANTSQTAALLEPRVVKVPNTESGGEIDAVRWPRSVEEEMLFSLETSQARIGVAKHAVVLACDDGSLQLLAPDGPFVIHKESSKLRGAVIGELDPLVEGEEAATAGYGKTMTILYRGADWRRPWKAVTLWRDTDRFHHLAAGELLEQGLGLELVGVGYSGRVIVAARTRR